MCDRSGIDDECDDGRFTGDVFDGEEEKKAMQEWIQCANSKKDGLYSDECSKLAPAEGKNLKKPKFTAKDKRKCPDVDEVSDECLAGYFIGQGLMNLNILPKKSLHQAKTDAAKAMFKRAARAKGDAHAKYNYIDEMNVKNARGSFIGGQGRTNIKKMTVDADSQESYGLMLIL